MYIKSVNIENYKGYKDKVNTPTNQNRGQLRQDTQFRLMVLIVL